MLQPVLLQPVLLQRAHAGEYRALMLNAYAQYPDAFTSSRGEREGLPLSWWEARLASDAQGQTSGQADAKEQVIGAFVSASSGENVLAGVVGVSFETREKARHKSTLFGMVVSEPYRGQGFGDLLVVAALDLARARSGVRLMQLTVTQGNDAAYALYTRHGFKPFGLEPMAVAVGDHFVAKCHMWRDLQTGA
jgi:ribosomal protein S18 acetylase RimI-like enzyme